MEYGLWNIPGGFWGTTPGAAQGQVPPEALTRQYYAPAVFHPAGITSESPEGAVSYGLTGSQSYRHQTEFIKSAAMTNAVSMAQIPGRTSVHDDRSGEQGIPLHGNPAEIGDLIVTGPSTEDSNCVSDDGKLKIEVKQSPQWEREESANTPQQTIIKTETPAALEYLAQQSYQHPMYNMLFGTAKITTGPTLVDGAVQCTGSKRTEELAQAQHHAVAAVDSDEDDDDDDDDEMGGRQRITAVPDTISPGFNHSPPQCETPESGVGDDGSSHGVGGSGAGGATVRSSAGYECGECGLVADTRPALRKHLETAHAVAADADSGAVAAAGLLQLRKLSGGTAAAVAAATAATAAAAATTSCPMPFCRFRTTERHEMEAHVAQHVAEGFSPNGKKKNCPVALQRVRYEREEYRCQLCAYSCTIEKAFYKHLKSHTQQLQLPSPLPQQPQQPQVKISCVICGKDRNSEVDMNKHMKKHRDDRYFCCDICIFKTVQLKKLIQHRRMHTGEKPHLCPHCSYRSARRDNLRSHVRRVHKKENLYCDTFSPRGLLVTPSANVLSSPPPASSSDTPTPPHLHTQAPPSLPSPSDVKPNE